MATLTVLKFTTELGADNALGIIQEMTEQQLITLHDAAIVTWPMINKKPKTKHLQPWPDAKPWMAHFGGCYLASFFSRPC